MKFLRRFEVYLRHKSRDNKYFLKQTTKNDRFETGDVTIKLHQHVSKP